MSDKKLTFTTTLWQRSENSFASTIPKGLFGARGADPHDEDLEVNWELDLTTGEITVTFTPEHRDEDD